MKGLVSTETVLSSWLQSETRKFGMKQTITAIKRLQSLKFVFFKEVEKG